MNSRERVLRAIKFEYPDKVPVGYHFTGAVLLKYGEEILNLCKKYPSDFFDVSEMKVPEKDIQHYREDGSYYKETIDEWGCKWVFFEEGIGGEVKESPLDDWSKLKNYKIPSPGTDKEEIKKKKEEMKKIKERYIGWHSGGILFERMQWLRGVENLLIDIALDREEVYILADRILNEYIIPSIETGIEIGAEVIGFGDDWGGQNQLLINPISWRKIFKPRYKKMFEVAREGGALTWFHSDGMIIEILPDFIEIGLNVINPQFSCMDMEAIKNIIGKKMCIYTDIDRQKLLPYGNPEEIDEYIKRVFDLFGFPEGGLIYGCGIYPDVPFENIQALLSSFYKYRDLKKGGK